MVCTEASTKSIKASTMVMPEEEAMEKQKNSPSLKKSYVTSRECYERHYNTASKRRNVGKMEEMVSKLLLFLHKKRKHGIYIFLG